MTTKSYPLGDCQSFLAPSKLGVGETVRSFSLREQMPRIHIMGVWLCPDAAEPILRHQQLGGREGLGRLPADEMVGQNSGGPGSKAAGGGHDE